MSFLKLSVGVVFAIFFFSAQQVGAQVVQQSPGDFSLDATEVTLELELGSTFSGPIGNLLEALGVVFEVGVAADGASSCPGQVDVIAGGPSTVFTNEIQIRFVDPASGAPGVTEAFGIFVGSLVSGGGSGQPPAGTISEVTLKAFDINGILVGSVVTSPGSPDRNLNFPVGDFLGVRFDGGIHRVVLTNDPSTDFFAMGDFFVTANSPACSFDFDFVFEPVACPCGLFTATAFEPPMGKKKKIGSTLPIKFQLFFDGVEIVSEEQLNQILEDNGCAPGCPKPVFFLETGVMGLPLDDVEDNVGDPDEGDCFRYSAPNWIYNVRLLPPAFMPDSCYTVQIEIGDDCVLVPFNNAFETK